MSFFEILVILFVSLFVLRNEDLKLIMKTLSHFRNQYFEWKNEFLEYLDLKNEATFQDEPDKINSYLKKIADMGSYYQGEYDLEEVKKFYEDCKKKHNNISNHK